MSSDSENSSSNRLVIVTPSQFLHPLYHKNVTSDDFTSPVVLSSPITPYQLYSNAKENETPKASIMDELEKTLKLLDCSSSELEPLEESLRPFSQELGLDENASVMLENDQAASKVQYFADDSSLEDEESADDATASDSASQDSDENRIRAPGRRDIEKICLARNSVYKQTKPPKMISAAVVTFESSFNSSQKARCLLSSPEQQTSSSSADSIVHMEVVSPEENIINASCVEQLCISKDRLVTFRTFESDSIQKKPRRMLSCATVYFDNDTYGTQSNESLQNRSPSQSEVLEIDSAKSSDLSPEFCCDSDDSSQTVVCNSKQTASLDCCPTSKKLEPLKNVLEPSSKGVGFDKAFGVIPKPNVVYDNGQEHDDNSFCSSGNPDFRSSSTKVSVLINAVNQRRDGLLRDRCVDIQGTLTEGVKLSSTTAPKTFFKSPGMMSCAVVNFFSPLNLSMQTLPRNSIIDEYLESEDIVSSGTSTEHVDNSAVQPSISMERYERMIQGPKRSNAANTVWKLNRAYLKPPEMMSLATVAFDNEENIARNNKTPSFENKIRNCQYRKIESLTHHNSSTVPAVESESTEDSLMSYERVEKCIREPEMPRVDPHSVTADRPKLFYNLRNRCILIDQPSCFKSKPSKVSRHDRSKTVGANPSSSSATKRKGKSSRRKPSKKTKRYQNKACYVEDAEKLGVCSTKGAEAASEKIVPETEIHHVSLYSVTEVNSQIPESPYNLRRRKNRQVTPINAERKVVKHSKKKPSRKRIKRESKLKTPSGSKIINTENRDASSEHEHSEKITQEFPLSHKKSEDQISSDIDEDAIIINETISNELTCDIATKELSQEETESYSISQDVANQPSEASGRQNDSKHSNLKQTLKSPKHLQGFASEEMTLDLFEWSAVVGGNESSHYTAQSEDVDQVFAKKSHVEDHEILTQDTNVPETVLESIIASGTVTEEQATQMLDQNDSCSNIEATFSHSWNLRPKYQLDYNLDKDVELFSEAAQAASSDSESMGWSQSGSSQQPPKKKQGTMQSQRKRKLELSVSASCSKSFCQRQSPRLKKQRESIYLDFDARSKSSASSFVTGYNLFDSPKRTKSDWNKSAKRKSKNRVSTTSKQSSRKKTSVSRKDVSRQKSLNASKRAVNKESEEDPRILDNSELPPPPSVGRERAIRLFHSGFEDFLDTTSDLSDTPHQRRIPQQPAKEQTGVHLSDNVGKETDHVDELMENEACVDEEESNHDLPEVDVCEEENSHDLLEVHDDVNDAETEIYCMLEDGNGASISDGQYLKEVVIDKSKADDFSKNYSFLSAEESHVTVESVLNRKVEKTKRMSDLSDGKLKHMERFLFDSMKYIADDSNIFVGLYSESEADSNETMIGSPGREADELSDDSLEEDAMHHQYEFPDKCKEPEANDGGSFSLCEDIAMLSEEYVGYLKTVLETFRMYTSNKQKDELNVRYEDEVPFETSANVEDYKSKMIALYDHYINRIVQIKQKLLMIDIMEELFFEKFEKILCDISQVYQRKIEASTKYALNDVQYLRKLKVPVWI